MIRVTFKDVHRIVPDAFHGTSVDNAESIIESGQFEISRDEKSYLGDGVYFYESSFENAKSWGDKRSPGLCAVIQSKVNLGRCLDLHDKRHSDFVVSTFVSLEQKTDKEITDAFVINFIADLADNTIDTIRATYISGTKVGTKWRRKKVFPGSKFFYEQQLMICVRNHANILDCKVCYRSAGGSK